MGHIQDVCFPFVGCLSSFSKHHQLCLTFLLLFWSHSSSLPFCVFLHPVNHLGAHDIGVGLGVELLPGSMDDALNVCCCERLEAESREGWGEKTERTKR